MYNICSGFLTRILEFSVPLTSGSVEDGEYNNINLYEILTASY